MNFLRWLYEPKQRDIRGKYDVVVAHDYLILSDGSLPEATIKCLNVAMRLVSEGWARNIAWANTATSGADPNDMNRRKLEYLCSMGFTRKPIAMIECTNTITEVGGILSVIPWPSSVISVCEWRHARRTQKIWRHFFSGKLAVVTFDCDWKENHVSGWCRSKWGIPAKWVFLVANLGHHLLMTLRGVEALRNVKHSSKLS